MSKHNVVKVSCSCGAQLIFEEILTGESTWYAKASSEHGAFLKAHEVCRTKANTSEVVKKLLGSGGSE